MTADMRNAADIRSAAEVRNADEVRSAAEARNAAEVRNAADIETLVRNHLPLVGHLVREMLGRLPAHVSREDLISAGMAALAGAAKSFDPQRGTPFGSFATTRIRGALLDELRGLDWASRSVRSRARRLDQTQQELTATLGRVPTQAELAAALGVGIDEIKSVDEDVQRAVVLSLQGFAAGTAEDMVPERAAGPEELLVHRERVGYLHNAIDALPDRLRRVVVAYFFEERPMLEIAAELGVTESRVSQLRAEALVLLRDGLNSHLDPELVSQPDRPGGCVARRREAYYAAIAAHGDLRSRLDLTDQYGLPLNTGMPPVAASAASARSAASTASAAAVAATAAAAAAASITVNAAAVALPAAAAMASGVEIGADRCAGQAEIAAELQVESRGENAADDSVGGQVAAAAEAIAKDAAIANEATIAKKAALAKKTAALQKAAAAMPVGTGLSRIA